MTQPDQLELFAAKPQAPKRRTAPASDKPKWTKYNPAKAKRPHLCDFCKANDHDAMRTESKWWNLSSIPRKARYLRRAGESVLYLCSSHADDQRVIDGLPKIKERQR